jgi:fructokinase
MKTYWGIDLGGTKIECVVLSSPSPGAVIARQRIDTEAHKGYEHIINQIEKLIRDVEAQTGYNAEGVGFSTPGTHDPMTQTMKGCNTTVLNGRRFKEDLTTKLGIPIAIANDANCFALAEATMGVVPDLLPDYQCVFGVIMGTGVGGGIVFKAPNGSPFVLNGLQGIGGEWGHNELEANGYDCYCGKKGCVETVLSGPFLQRYYNERSGETRTLADIIARHQTGQDPHATATVDRMLDYFGKAIALITNILDPDAIVIGGGVGKVDLLYDEGVARVKKYIFNNGQFNTPVLRPKLGDSAGVFGAAMLNY